MSRVRPKHTSLIIQDLALQVRLGCLPDERVTPQEVRISVEFRFPEPPRANCSDELTDTICYAEVCEALKTIADEQEYKLIERLAQRLWEKLSSITDVPFSLSVHKVSPPVLGLRGGSILRMGDFL